MRLGFGITQEQTQKLMMTPELRLAIKILQLSAIELEQYIEEQLVENPVLELAEEPGENDREDQVEENKGFEDDKSDIDWEQFFDNVTDAKRPEQVNREMEAVKYDNFVAEIPTLQDHLSLQLGLAGLNNDERKVGEFYIGNIDDNGYIHCSVDEAAIHCGVPFALSQKVLKIIQSFDPPGVGAANLRECLLIQYEQLGLNNNLMKEVITNHLPEIANGKIMKVAKSLGVTLKDLQEAVDLLKLLEPKPGRKFSPGDGTRYIVPDVIVERIENEYIVLVNDTSVPRLAVNPVYREMIKGHKADQESRKYLENKLNSAVWLMKSIEQRRLTLYKVARSIVDFQRDFLEGGVRFLKPMNLKKVAETIGVHESTVSRATANKFMQTPQGVFEMKFLFSSGVSGTHGPATSAEAVKKVLREIIDGENPKKPLSDQKIADLFHAQGVDISRRTVAKYRDELGISPTSKRRRY